MLIVEVRNSKKYQVEENNSNGINLVDMVIDNLNDVIVRYVLIEKKGERDNGGNLS